MKKGVFVSCSSGNSGPQLTTVENVAPWLMTVAASTIDRQFKAAVKLGNGVTISVRNLSKNMTYPPWLYLCWAYLT